MSATKPVLVCGHLFVYPGEQLFDIHSTEAYTYTIDTMIDIGNNCENTMWF